MTVIITLTHNPCDEGFSLALEDHVANLLYSLNVSVVPQHYQLGCFAEEEASIRGLGLGLGLGLR